MGNVGRNIARQHPAMAATANARSAYGYVQAHVVGLVQRISLEIVRLKTNMKLFGSTLGKA